MKPSGIDEFWAEYRIELHGRGYRVPPKMDALWCELMLRWLKWRIQRICRRRR
jgi:hypothetical protein